MQKQAFGASRIHYWIKALRTIARRASLSDPEFVDAHLTSTEVSEEKLVEGFVQFAAGNGSHSRSRTSDVGKVLLLPTGGEVHALISV